MSIPDIEYSFDAADITCGYMQYLCVELSKGDDPRPLHSEQPFVVEGVVSEEDFQVVPRNLRGCSEAPPCIGTFLQCLI